MSEAKISGLNHLTLAVTDLERSVAFYRDVLGCELRAVWCDGAYLEAGPLWLCLSVDTVAPHAERPNYTHYAFDVAGHHFEALSERVRRVSTLWKDNKSEGASVYFLDPDGHRMELHMGSLASRLEHYRTNPSSGVTVL
jgi:catechol 2,3-dioxygenase-like lactoylglutathione lyase family enzyme